MMTENEIKNYYKKVCNSTESRRLKPAFDLLGKLITENGLGIFYDEYQNMEETYQYMLKYTVEGISDPERQKVYQKLIASVFKLADEVYESLREKLSSSVEYDKKRFLSASPLTNLGEYINELEDFYLHDKDSADLRKQDVKSGTKESDIQPKPIEDLRKEHHKKVIRLFYYIWFTDKLIPEESKRWRKILQSTALPATIRSFLVTGLTHSLQRYFDQNKFMLLFDCYDSAEPGIRQRALVGLIINLYRYDRRLGFYGEITGRLKIINENPRFRSNLERVVIQFIRSKETEKLQQRIRDEILPEMIRISPHLKNKISLDSLMEEGAGEDKNPDWHDIFSESPGLINKMEEFSELQMKGSDVFMGSFSMLKSFPFFNEMGNWFMPFYPWNPDIAEILDISDPAINNLVEALERAPIMCNSDKYSLCLSIQRLPKENLGFMSQAMQAEMDQLKEINDDEAVTDPGRNEEFISNQYIQDLYRFYKLYPRKGDFEDIFNWRLDFHNTILLGSVLRDDLRMLRNIGEFYFAKDHYKEAAEIFNFLLEQEKSGELYQKVAWCAQKTGDFHGALDNYLKAELYEVNQLWNQKKIALCYRNLKKPGKALKYYQAVEKTDPDDLTNQLNIGHCLLELNKFDEALKCYFKVEYLAPGNRKVWRPIAWCSFLTGKKEQAMNYLQKLLDEEPNKHDLINMGHVQWSLGNRMAALDHYRMSIARSSSEQGDKPGLSDRFTQDEFLSVFENDMPYLLDQGIEADDIPIMLDQLRYLVEGRG